jgi:hypothetical protein
MSESLGWTPKAFREAFHEVFREGLAKADWDAPLIWVVNAIKYNPPASPNVVRSWSSAWDEIPECELKSEIYQHLRAFMEGLGEAFLKAFREALKEPFGESGTGTGIYKYSVPSLRSGTESSVTGSVTDPQPSPDPDEPKTESDPQPEDQARIRGSVPAERIRELYNQTCADLPACKVLTSTRRKHLAARWREHPDMTWWTSYFERIHKSDFLCGRLDGRAWRANFDWVLRPANMAKILEGNYDNRVQDPWETWARKQGGDHE